MFQIIIICSSRLCVTWFVGLLEEGAEAMVGLVLLHQHTLSNYQKEYMHEYKQTQYFHNSERERRLIKPPHSFKQVKRENLKGLIIT